MSSFSELGLSRPLLSALADEAYAEPTPIQAQAIPHVLLGRDLLGIAQTGTGKTAAFALPILQRLSAAHAKPVRGRCRVLVLSPTRELASQIAESFRTYGKHLRHSVAVVFGGVPYGAQRKALAGGLDVLVATPGRLLDHLEQGTVSLQSVEVFVLDEADRMLDMGFIQPIRKIVRALPKVRQNLFFSATMPREIGALAADLLRDPVRVAVTPVATTLETVDQRVILVDSSKKRDVLAELLADRSVGRTLVFTRTKRGADRVAKHLVGAGVDAAAIHGNKSQGQRERALAAFRSGRPRVLVATDIAARGIDVDGITHVVNFDLPDVPETYVHRIGRTARAGATGVAISLCGGEEKENLREIEKLIRRSLPSTRHSGGGPARPEAAEPRNGSRPRSHHAATHASEGRGPRGGRGDSRSKGRGRKAGTHARSHSAAPAHGRARHEPARPAVVREEPKRAHSSVPFGAMV